MALLVFGCVPDLDLELPPDSISLDGSISSDLVVQDAAVGPDLRLAIDSTLEIPNPDFTTADGVSDSEVVVEPKLCQEQADCPEESFCVAGFCCNTECSGPCEGCNLTGMEGTCASRACDYPIPNLPGVDWSTASIESEDGFPSDCDDLDGTPCNRANPRFHWPNNSGQKACFTEEILVQSSECDDSAGTEECSSLVACGQDGAYSTPQGWAPSVRYFDKNGSVKDQKTGLIWLLEGSEALDWQSAVEFCRQQDPLTVGAWRLPDFYELMSLTALGAESPGGYLTTFLKEKGLWSSTTVSGLGTESYAWSFSPGSSRFVHTEKTDEESMIAHCVARGTGPQTQARFLFDDDVEGKNLVFDARTGLIWMAGPIDVNEAGRTWNEALSYCEDLYLAGRRDWRLANINELSGLYDTTRTGAAIVTEAFSSVPTTPIWSSTTTHPSPESAWSFDYFSATTPMAVLDKELLGFGFWCVNRWLVKGSNSVVDLKTGRVWSKEVPEPMNSDDAKTYCSELHQSGLWGVPTIQALRSLISGCAGAEEGALCAVHDPDCLDGFGLLGEDPCLNQSCSPECDLDLTTIDGCAWTSGAWDEDDCDTFWSASEAIVLDGSAQQSYAVSFTSGSVQIDNPNQLRSVRCVLEPESIAPIEPVDPTGPEKPPGEGP